MNFDEFNNAIDKITESNHSMVDSGLENMKKTYPCVFDNAMFDNWKSYFDRNTSYFRNNVELFNNYLSLCNYTVLKTMGVEVDAVIEPDNTDRRFFDESWNEYAVFDHIKQFYLLISQYTLNTIAENDQLDEKYNKKIDFYTKQWLDALSPTNFAATNPAVINETLNSNGKNLVVGASAMMEDFVRGKGQQLMTRMTDYSSFEVGKNVATTPGKVVYQNELMQLIQYNPTTKTVFETPLLIIPPLDKQVLCSRFKKKKTVLSNGLLTNVILFLSFHGRILIVLMPIQNSKTTC